MELHEEGLRCLRLQFPMKIEEWDAVYDESSFIIGKKDVLAIEIANICRFLRLSEFHLPALYLCCALPMKTLKLGATLKEGEDVKVQLNQDDLAVCVEAKKGLRNLLQTNMENLVWDFPSEEGALCHDQDLCDATVKNLQVGVDWPRGLGSRPYSALDSFWWLIDSLDDLCSNCTDFYHSKYAEMRQNVRDDLKSYITIPDY